MSNAQRRVRVAKVEPVARNIKRFELVAADGNDLTMFSAGSHVIVTMRDGDRVWRNPYSLMSSPEDRGHYAISVLRVDDSRGGSAFMHEAVREGSELEIGEPVNLFPLSNGARKHIMIAGGIGITPFLAMIEELKQANVPWDLHYACKSPEQGAYREALSGLNGGHVYLYCSSEGTRIPLESILSNQPLGTHLYSCGPERMIDWVVSTARHAGWPDENVHVEYFAAAPPGKPFSVEIASASKQIQVGEHQSILEALEQAGVDAPYLCRGGACGQCVVGVLNIEGGNLVHNDHYLSDEEKKAGKSIATCVSRLDGGCLTLDI